ncbi:MAG: type II toxin-antitoxin system death-on-curing family toxin [Candidatus Nanohaloarchaea archaeon]
MDDKWHPDVEDIIAAHEYAAFVSKIRTSGFHLSRDRGIRAIRGVIEEARKEDDAYRSAAVYLKKLIEKHPFGDGNHRTAYIVALQFIRENGETFVPEQVMGDDEISSFLKSEIKSMDAEDIAAWIRTGETDG